MQLILVRHGTPDESDTLRPGDPPLSPMGWTQAQRVAQALDAEPITHIISSPMQRAMNTARPLADRTGLPVQVVPGWAEADRGAVKYRSTETLRSQGKEEWQRFLRDPITYLGADTETFRREVLGALHTTINFAPDSTVAVFTHGMPINVVLAHALGLDSLVRFAPGYCSVTRLRARSLDAMTVVSVNELWHQPNKQT